jgi:hypothetical protein
MQAAHSSHQQTYHKQRFALDVSKTEIQVTDIPLLCISIENHRRNASHDATEQKIYTI